MMSLSKPFVFALVCQHLGADSARSALGVNATGLPGDALSAVERAPDGRTNPFAHPGAIAAASLIPGATIEAKWRLILAGLSAFAGRQLSLNVDIHASLSKGGERTRSAAWLMRSYGWLGLDPSDASELHSRQCAINVSAQDLAVMAATLAHGGVNPLSRLVVVDADCCRATLAVMATAGLREISGAWLYDTGLPATSGLSGGIVTVSPGKGGLGVFAPPIDDDGISVKGQLVAKFLAERLGMNLFLSKPDA
jgi:glutaminase